MHVIGLVCCRVAGNVQSIFTGGMNFFCCFFADEVCELPEIQHGGIVCSNDEENEGECSVVCEAGYIVNPIRIFRRAFNCRHPDEIESMTKAMVTQSPCLRKFNFYVAICTRKVFNSLPPGKFFMLFCCLLIFFKFNFFEKNFQEYHQSVKHIWIPIRTDILSGLFWAQSVCNSYQQTTLGGKELTKSSQTAKTHIEQC